MAAAGGDAAGEGAQPACGCSLLHRLQPGVVSSAAHQASAAGSGRAGLYRGVECLEVQQALLAGCSSKSDAAMARSVRAAGDQASLQQQQQQQDGVQALVAAASGTDDPILQMHYYMQHLQGELERVEALEHWKRVEQVRMRAVAVTMRRMPAGLAGLGCCNWHLLVTQGIRQGLQLTSALLPTQMCAALSCLYTCAAIASVHNRSRQALMWPRLRQRLRYQHR